MLSKNIISPFAVKIVFIQRCFRDGLDKKSVAYFIDDVLIFLSTDVRYVPVIPRDSILSKGMDV